MSVRESIAKNIVSVLEKSSDGYKFKLVTRQPFDFDRLSNAQFPSVLVRSASESRGDSTIGGTMGKRLATISYEVVCYVKNTNIDKERNRAVEAVEELLDADRTRGGYALNTQITGVDIDDGSIEPVGGVIITIECIYEFSRGVV